MTQFAAVSKQFGRVAVLMGGDSAEREISLKSGQAAVDALLRKEVDAFALDVHFNRMEAGNICEQLTNAHIDTAFIALHGRGGEDGTIQAVLETLGIPYTGCNVPASAIAMDKLRSKLLWAGRDLPTPVFERLKATDINADTTAVVQERLTAIVQKLGFPVMVKPAHEGSSIGMSKADNSDELRQALITAAQYDDEIMVEQWVTGQEFTGAVLNTQALPLIRLQTPREFYDYQAKYVSDDTIYHCPCGLDKVQEQKYQALVLEAFECVGASGWGRVDFMCDEQGQPWLIELNTVPGLTDHSLVPMAARQSGIEFDELIFRILQTAGRHD